MKLRDLLAIVGLLQMNRQVTGHTRNGPGDAMHEYPATTKHRPVDTTNPLEIQETILANVRNHQAELIGMTREKDRR